MEPVWRAEVVESMQRLRKDRSFILAEVKGLVLKSTVAQSVEYMNETHPHQLRGAAACVSVPLIPLIPLISAGPAASLDLVAW